MRRRVTVTGRPMVTVIPRHSEAQDVTESGCKPLGSGVRPPGPQPASGPSLGLSMIRIHAPAPGSDPPDSQSEG